MTEPRWDLVAHIRHKIEQDPERYANDAALRSVADKILRDLGNGNVHREVMPEENAT